MKIEDNMISQTIYIFENICQDIITQEIYVNKEIKFE